MTLHPETRGHAISFAAESFGGKCANMLLSALIADKSI